MSQSLACLLVHIVFSTKGRVNAITPDIESELFAYIAGTARGLGCRCLAINGTANHLHLLMVLSKDIALSAAIGRIKRSSSVWIKTKGKRWSRFQWQSGYGAFSIGQSRVAALERYIARQKEHHARRTFQDEVIELLTKYRVEYDPTYLWDE